MLRVAKKKSSKQNKQYKIKKKQVATTEFLLKKRKWDLVATTAT